ncbi:hypothetical protein HBE96_07065 [Clostridium sp. P21]|uniref:Uncharacterized protein n=1 Tax=Clostridium muellerianum TaxID=2716538 RepID=A0A7Y0EFI7_9CLOT|nr:hypothetical protein [Clostridium muellerianum]NMM62453.1 hypothetical protein [Clostridium muellerianum]
MDQFEKLNLIRKIQEVQSQCCTHEKEILISIDDYFKGNDESHCIILANTSVNLSSKEFEKFLRNLKRKDNVMDVFIRFYDYEDAMDYEDAWINSDTVFLITSADVQKVKSWFQGLEPSSVKEETCLNEFVNLPYIPEKYRIINVWWD